MMQKNIIILSMIIIFLIPIVSAANTLTLVRYSGNDNGNGFIRQQDDLTIQAEVEVDGDTLVMPNQVRLFDSPDPQGKQFQDCKLLSGSKYLCTYQEKDASTGKYKIGSLVDNEINSPHPKILQQTTFEISYDNAEPNILLFNITPIISKDGKVKLNYNVEDYGAFPGDKSKCSGVKEVIFNYENNTLYQDKGTQGQCSLSKSVGIIKSPTSSFEEVNVVAQATDYVNRKNAVKKSTFYVDNDAPKLVSSALVDSQGFELTHLKTGEKRKVSISAEIQGNNIFGKNDVDSKSVRVDVSKINPQAIREIQMDKTSDTTFVAEIEITQPRNCEYTIKARDIIGNELNEKVSCSVSTDNIGPTVKSIKTRKQLSNGNLVLGKNDTIIVELEDFDDVNSSGIGLNASKIFLNLETIGMKKSSKADYCIKQSAGLWECYWNTYSNAKDGSKIISIDELNSRDDLDNKIQNKIDAKIDLDSTVPEIFNIVSVRPIHQQDDYGPIVVRGDQIEFVLNVSEEGDLMANFTDFGALEIVKGVGCQQNETSYLCTINAEVSSSGPYIANITFKLLDKADNKAVRDYKQPVFAIKDDKNPDYWKVRNVECSPEYVSVSTASVMNYPVFCNVVLDPKSRSQSLPETTSITIPTWQSDCRGINQTLTGNIKSIKMINNHAGSKNPFLQIDLHKKQFSINNLTISCDLQIMTKQGNIFTTSAEKETLTATIFFKDTKSINHASKEQIDDAVKKAEGMKWLDDIKQFLDQSQEICRIKQTVTGTVGVLYLLTSKLEVIKNSLALVPGAQASAEALRVGTCNTAEITHETYQTTMFDVLDKYCMISNCQLESGKGDWGISQIVGGQAPWCKEAEQYLTSGSLGKTLSAAQGYKQKAGVPNPQIQALNVKDSLVLSSACFCLPGIINNIEKHRQLECRYATCLLRDVKERGYSVSECRSEKGYNECAYVYGELWNIVPFSQFFDMISNMLGDLIADPGRAAITVLGLACQNVCPNQPGYAACAGARVVSTISEAVASFKEIKKKSSWIEPKSQNFCNEFKDAKSKYYGK